MAGGEGGERSTDKVIKSREETGRREEEEEEAAVCAERQPDRCQVGGDVF